MGLGPPRGAKASDEGKGTLGEGQSAREVGGGVKGRSEPVPEPPKRVAGPEQLSFDLNGGEAPW